MRQSHDARLTAVVERIKRRVDHVAVRASIGSLRRLDAAVSLFERQIESPKGR
jgi:hypothetical protein